MRIAPYTTNLVHETNLFVKGANYLKEISVRVDDNDLEKAMRILKKKIQNDGLFKRLRLKKNYEKPSEYKRRKKREAQRRARIAEAKKRTRFKKF